MKQELEKAVGAVVKELFGTDVVVELTRPDEQFGDYATNVALQLAGKVGKSPREIAEQLAENLKGRTFQVEEVVVAGPGFLNIKLSDKALVELASQKPAQPLAGQTIVAEYSDPNPFKVLHAGHLYTSVVGDGIANLLENAGAKVHRVNFGGDVGLHVGKTMWAILKDLGGENPEKLKDFSTLDQQVNWLSNCYIAGNNAYENEEYKPEIIELNKRIYQVHDANDRESALARIYWTTREWSYDYFQEFYKHLGSEFERYYPESETAPIGLQVVREHTLGRPENKDPEHWVYAQSEEAIIFPGEKFNLHTRVFVNSQGLPTYEAKDVGLIMKKWQDYHFDRSVVITGNDIIEYMKVVLKSIEQYPEPELAQLAKRTTHLTHGIVKLAGGVKMSSRLGNILRAADVLNAANRAYREVHNNGNGQAVLGAVKYAFLKNRLGGDIIYDPKESVSLEGNSGPYLQYAHARARSILAKAQVQDKLVESFEPDERSLLRKLGEYPEVVEQATDELMPHHICTYLYELAQKFNSFYEKNRVIGDPRQEVRLQLVQAYADTLKNGLELLGIAAPDKM